jgi:hypothetical protein
LGEDTWCGRNKEWKLFQSLINVLQRKYLFTQKYAVVQNFEGVNVGWKLASKLDLSGGFIEEWNVF